MRLGPTNGDPCRRSAVWIVGLDPQCETAELLPPDFHGHSFPVNVLLYSRSSQHMMRLLLQALASYFPTLVQNIGQ